jgi:PAS domain-containing protein
VGEGLPLKHVTVLLGLGLAILAAFIVLVYLLHRAFRRARAGELLTAPPPRAQNEAAFAAAAFQGAIANLKQQERELRERLREAERRADASDRTLAFLFQELSAVVLVFDAEGVLVQASSSARTLLGLDTWSRRRYSDLLAGSPALAEMIRACLEEHEARQERALEVGTSDGKVRNAAAVVSACNTREGKIEGVVCVLEVAGSETTSSQRP